jgi:stalled ribosome rescue protein Dom34
MSQKNKKQFGVWMDTHHAIVVGRKNEDTTDFSVIGHSENAGAEFNTSEKNAHNDEKTLQHKFFKEILTYMQNAEEVHLTGTGTSQEQLMHYMAETQQFKNTVTQESTSNKMSDENLAEYIAAMFN